MKKPPLRLPYLSARRSYQRNAKGPSCVTAFKKTREFQVAQKFGIPAPFPRLEVATLWIKRQVAIRDWNRARYYLDRAKAQKTIARWEKSATAARAVLEQCPVPPPYVRWDHVHAFLEGSPMMTSY
jgi:hypothetical protein